jgi:hypothetical protein
MIDYATWCAIRDGAARHLTPAQLARGTGSRYQDCPGAGSTGRMPLGKPPDVQVSSIRSRAASCAGWKRTPYPPSRSFSAWARKGSPAGSASSRDYVRLVRPASTRSVSDALLRPRRMCTSRLGASSAPWQWVRPSVACRSLSWSSPIADSCTSSSAWRRRWSSSSGRRSMPSTPLAVSPKKVMIDNLRCGVVQHRRGEPPVFNPRYLDFARHYGFEIVACNVCRGNEKGRAERGVGVRQA